MPPPTSVRDLRRRQFQAVAVTAIDKHADAIGELRADLRELARDHAAFTARGFWARLRWLATGR